MNLLINHQRKGFFDLIVVLLLTALYVGGICRISAQSIGINFVGGAGAAGTLAPGDVAGVPGFAQPFWNNLSGAFGSLSNVMDGLGQQTSVDVSTVGIAGVGTTGSTGVGPDFILMRGYLSATAAGNGVVLSDIPYPLYDLIVYMSGPLSTSGSSGSLFYRTPDFNTFPPVAEFDTPQLQYSTTFTGTFGQATPTGAGNYYRFTGLSYNSIGVGSIYFSLAGVQIIPVPEPSTNVLLVFAVTWLVFHLRSRGRERNRHNPDAMRCPRPA